jgi:poly(3-hydroxybutyrate) depolymerase
MRIAAHLHPCHRLAATLAVLLGAFSTHAHAGREVLRYEIDGQSRTVLVHTPGGTRSGPPPLVVLFHGLGDDNTSFAEAVRLHRDWPEAIIAYPRGEPLPSSKMRGWQARAGELDDRDLKLVDRLLTDMAERHGVQPAQTYAAGFSNGGRFQFVLMDARADAFAAFAVIGTVRPDFASDAPPRPLLYLYGRGENRAHRDHWANTIQALVRHNRTQGALVDFLACCKLQAPGPGGAALAFGLYNAGHTWPHRGNEWLKAFFARDWQAPGDG